jgi:general secretion pathway protein F
MSGKRALQLEDLVVLNEELAALVRAGLPLDVGLAEAARELGGGAGALARRLSERLARGERLSEALEAERGLVPPLYRAVVAAGERSGDLAGPLARVAELTARLRSLRANTGLALVYPVVVCLVAAGAWTLWSRWLFPVQLEAAGDVRLALPEWLRGLHRVLIAVDGTVPLPVFPGILLLALLVWWRQSGRTSVLAAGRAAWLLGWVPWSGKVLRWSQQALLAETLAVLLEHRVSAEEALPLAAEAAGGGALAAGAAELADQLRRGQRPGHEAAARLPALAAWLLAVPYGHSTALRLLRAAAERYRHWAETRVQLARTGLPYLLIIFFLGPLVLAYSASVFVPTLRFLEAVVGE